MLADIEARLAVMTPVMTGVEIVFLVFVLVMVSETVWDRFSGYRQSLKETGANLFIGLIYNLLDQFLFGILFVVALFVAEPFAFANLPVTWWSWALAILGADFTYYWMHRLEHRVRLLWTYHSVHHSSPEFNFTTAFRLAWIEALFVWMFFIPMVLTGFDPAQVIGGLAIVIGYQSWIHTEKISRLDWLEKILNTPSNHRVHHACNAQYLDRNYGGLLIIWDRMFGTYAAEQTPVTYGITDPLMTSNPITINFRDTVKLVRDIGTAKSMKSAFKTLLKPPGLTTDKTNSQD